jgi:hypothetical protein
MARIMKTEIIKEEKQNHLHFPATDECSTILTFLPWILAIETQQVLDKAYPKHCPKIWISKPEWDV